MRVRPACCSHSDERECRLYKVGLMNSWSIRFRYENKYRKWMERLEISVSEEQLKKEIEEDGLMGMKLTCRRKTLLGKVTKLLHPYIQDRHLWIWIYPWISSVVDKQGA